MAIIDVKESWEGLEFNQGVEDASAPRIFTVKFDNADDPFVRPALAWEATGPGDRIPYIYERYHPKPYMWVHHKSVRALGPYLYEVAVHYSTRPVGPANEEPIDPTVSPLDLPWQIEWGFATREEPIDRDINGVPIANSADEAYDLPITRPFSDLVLSISRNQAEYNPILAADYKDALNSDPFFGFSPGIVRCTDLSGRSARNGDLFYWQVHHAFQMRKIGWTDRRIDKGYREKVGTDSDGKPEYVAIKMKMEDSDGAEEVPINQPAYLDGSGRKKKDSAAITILEFEIFESKLFSIWEL